MPHPLDSARDRLKRANENIGNLNSELTEFLSHFPRINFTGLNPVFSDEQRQAFEMLKKQAAVSALPRFSVLAGEIIHHLRSALGHVVWQLSSAAARDAPAIARRIEFPILDARPTIDKLSRYETKVQGISSATALARIESLQPYNALAPHNHPLWIVHDMDIVDKHRELNLVIPAVGTSINARGSQTATAVHDSASGGMRITHVGANKVQVYVELSAQVTFAEFGLQTNEPVIAGLQQLASFASYSVESFAGEFRDS